MTAQPWILMGMALIALVPGCSDPAGTLGADATLSYEGSENGSQSEKADCGDEGKISGTGKVSDGRVTVEITDSNGEELFSKSYSEDFTLGSQTFHGDSGTWTLAAVRAGNDLAGDEFSGSYTFNLSC